VEQAVLNVARYDVFKLSEAVLSGQVARSMRMLDGLQAEGEAEVLVHWALAEDIRNIKRVKDAMAGGKPLPMALRENRIWGPRRADGAAAAACQ
jgi:DNA polymerase-3 subunit delta